MRTLRNSDHKEHVPGWAQGGSWEGKMKKMRKKNEKIEKNEKMRKNEKIKEGPLTPIRNCGSYGNMYEYLKLTCRLA